VARRKHGAVAAHAASTSPAAADTAEVQSSTATGSQNIRHCQQTVSGPTSGRVGGGALGNPPNFSMSENVIPKILHLELKIPDFTEN